MAVALLVVATLAFALVCEVDVVKAKQFKVMKNKVNWFKAYQECRLLDGDYRLATIECSEEQTDIKQLIQNDDDAKDEHNLWIAATDLADEGVFRWFTNGKPLDYDNWVQGQPDNKNKEEDCVSLVEKKDYGWNDNRCSDEFYYVCEKNYGQSGGHDHHDDHDDHYDDFGHDEGY